MTLGHISTQVVARAADPQIVVHKWQIFAAIREARELLGATDRSIAILHALLSFHPETALSGPDGLIVWPSNEQLALRANGMSESTLRRHLAVLVDRGLIIRRDSPNGKRYARKRKDGGVDQAFGFDLSPLVARAQEIQKLADTVQAEKHHRRLMRERITLLRRDVEKMMETGLGEGVPADWNRLQETYLAIVERLPRNPSREAEPLLQELEALHNVVRELLEKHIKTSKMNGNGSQNDGHIQDTAPISNVHCNNRHRPHGRSVPRAPDGDFASDKKTDATSVRPQEERSVSEPNNQADLMVHIGLPLIKSACPDVVDILPEAFNSWADLRGSGRKLCSIAYINPQVWDEALQYLRHDVAICALVITVQRSWTGKIQTSAGAYMRSLIQRGSKGELNISQSLFAMAKSAIAARGMQ